MTFEPLPHNISKIKATDNQPGYIKQGQVPPPPTTTNTHAPLTTTNTGRKQQDRLPRKGQKHSLGVGAADQGKGLHRLWDAGTAPWHDGGHQHQSGPWLAGAVAAYGLPLRGGSCVRDDGGRGECEVGGGGSWGCGQFGARRDDCSQVKPCSLWPVLRRRTGNR